jgi:hypothetical protein
MLIKYVLSLRSILQWMSLSANGWQEFTILNVVSFVIVRICGLFVGEDNVASLINMDKFTGSMVDAAKTSTFLSGASVKAQQNGNGPHSLSVTDAGVNSASFLSGKEELHEQSVFSEKNQVQISSTNTKLSAAAKVWPKSILIHDWY